MEKSKKLEKGGNIAKEERRETKNVGELLELFLNLFQVLITHSSKRRLMFCTIDVEPLTQ